MPVTLNTAFILKIFLAIQREKIQNLVELTDLSEEEVAKVLTDAGWDEEGAIDLLANQRIKILKTMAATGRPENEVATALFDAGWEEGEAVEKLLGEPQLYLGRGLSQIMPFFDKLSKITDFGLFYNNLRIGQDSEFVKF